VRATLSSRGTLTGHPRPTVSAFTTAISGLSVCRNVGVVLGRGETRVTVLEGVDLTVRAGERVALWGRSGSGKSTLLHVLGGLLAPTSGSVDWEGAPLHTMDGADGRLRAPGIANVFQSANLLPFFTAFENVAFAARAVDGGTPEVQPLDLLRLVGLDGKADALPSELSGGEAQRVAIARSLAQRPRLLLCDEPTGHLDSDTGDRVLGLIEALQGELGFALVVATHDPDVAARFPREVELLDGHLIRDEGRG
jgi:predicted ABC-type transport system involved in lysophospholipase L1 biosynthesis ATPase subunit